MRNLSFFVVLALAIMFFISCGNAVLYHGLSEREANEILVILEQNGIIAEKIIDESQKKVMVFNIVVPRDDKNQALEIMKEKGLPRVKPVGIHDIFSGSSLIPTITEEKAKYQMAIQGEMEKTLLEMQNVISARVHIVMREADSIDQQSQSFTPKAAVFLKYYQGLQQNPLFTEKDIQNLVAGSVQDMSPGDVTVVLQRVQPIEAGQASPRYADFLYFKLAPESKKSMQISLIIVISIVFILLFSIVILFLKMKELKTSLSIIKSKK